MEIQAVIPAISGIPEIPGILEMTEVPEIPAGPGMMETAPERGRECKGKCCFSLKEQRKILLIITDGVPDSTHAARQALHIAQKLGFEVYGVGIRDDHIAQLLPEPSRGINDLSGMAPAMFGLLHNALVQGGAS